MTTRVALWITLACVVPGLAQAHGATDRPLGVTLDPWVAVPLLLTGGGYALGVASLWRRAGIGRGVRRWRAALYGGGWAALAGTLLSPLHAMGERLFSAHMVEHEIVMAVAAPLMVLARPAAGFLWAWPHAVRQAIGRVARRRRLRTAWRFVTAPVAATMLHGLAIWAWHLPAAFDAAVANITLHRLQHLSFLLSALLFWWSLLCRCSPGAATAHLFATMTHTGLLGALLTFAPRVLYAVQTAHAQEWGLSPLQDQQLAGLIMWVPAGTIYAAAALGFAALWIRRSTAVWEAGDAARTT